VEPPPRFRVKAPGVFRPGPATPLAGTLEEFVALQEHFQQRLHDAEGLHLRRIRVPSPAFRRLKIGLGAAFAVIAAHQRRHLWQAQQVRAAPASPRPPAG